MSNQERESPPERLGECDSLIANTLQMQHNHQVLAKYITAIKCQLDDLTEQFNNRPELQQIANLQDALAQEHQQLGERSASSEVPVEVTQTEVTDWVEKIPQPIHAQLDEYQLVFDRFESRSVLREALCESKERLIIVCPWLNRNSIDADLLQQFRDCLNRNCRIDIGWGYLSERSRLGIGWRYNALKDLRQLEQDYPDYFKLKLLGTHEKFLVCVGEARRRHRTFAMLGSHNVLTSNAQSAEWEAGIRTTDPQIIQGLIDRFDGAEMQDAQDTDEMTAGFVSLDDAEVDAPDIGYQSDANPVNLYDIELDEDEDIDDSAEDNQGTAINAEEFLRRYEAGERDFTGINLAGVNLSGLSLKDCNLSKANLTKANLSNTNLSGTKLSEANLLEPILNYANLTGADLRSAELSGAQLNYAKLVGTNLNGAGLIQAYLQVADLSGANLSYTNLTAAFLSSANLMKANLKGTNLVAANLSSSNLRKAEFNDKTRLSAADLSSVNLAGQNLQKINMSGVSLSNANLCGAWLCASNLSGANLASADLRGADLSDANLEKANLKGAKLSGANLGGAKLSGAIMPDGTTHE